LSPQGESVEDVSEEESVVEIEVLDEGEDEDEDEDDVVVSIESTSVVFAQSVSVFGMVVLISMVLAIKN